MYPYHLVVNRSTALAFLLIVFLGVYLYFDMTSWLWIHLGTCLFLLVSCWWIATYWVRLKPWHQVVSIVALSCVSLLVGWLSYICVKQIPRLTAMNLVTTAVVSLGLSQRRDQGKHDKYTALRFAFSPVLFCNNALAVPAEMLPVGDWSEAKIRRCAARGILYLITASIAIYATHFIYLNFVPATPPTTVFEFLWRGWINYLYYYFGWLAYLHLGVGVALWFGFDLDPPAHFAILSTNLLDRWRNWNRYYYWLCLTFIWLPIARRFKFIVLATALVFLFDFYVHNVMNLLWLFISKFYENQAGYLRGAAYLGPEYLGRELLFYSLHGIFVYFGFLTKKLWPPEHRRMGWIGVVVTHLCMAIVHCGLRFK